MTDRIHALTVVLDRDYRDDDVEHITKAIEMIRGVASVDLHVTQMEDHMARERVRRELALTISRFCGAILDGNEIQIVKPDKN